MTRCCSDLRVALLEMLQQLRQCSDRIDDLCYIIVRNYIYLGVYVYHDILKYLLQQLRQCSDIDDLCYIIVRNRIYLGVYVYHDILIFWLQ